MNKKWLILLMIPVAIFGAIRLYFYATDDFHRGNIIRNIPNRPEWEIPPLSAVQKEKLNLILKQKFRYLNKGAQSYALESEDGKYILKLFKIKHLKSSFLLKYAPLFGPLNHYRKDKIEKKARKLTSVLTGYHMAFCLHREESGLIYVHLNNHKDLNTIVSVTDKIRRRWTIDLDEVVFVIQKKSTKLRMVLSNLLSQGKVALAKQRIAQVLELYIKEYHKGIYDHDHGVMHNFGFVDGQPIHFDVGKLYQDACICHQKNFIPDLEKVTWKIGVWVARTFPHYQQEIVFDIEQALSKRLKTQFVIPLSSTSPTSLARGD